jgi:hypothetical protein
MVKFALAALICAGAAATLEGGTMTVTYQPAADQTPDATALCAPTTVCYVGMETFNSWNGSAPFATDFPALLTVGDPSGGIQGEYTGSLTQSSDYTYGGAGKTGYYPTVSDNNYTLTLSTLGDVPGVNYFGLWFSALDGGNQLQFYEGSTLLYTFTPTMFQTLVGACPGSAFCGNPNNGEDAGEQFAFLNFFYEGGYFDKIVFTETSSAGFESDNHTVAYLNPPVPSGTVIGDEAPEPGSIALVTLGAAGLIWLKRRATTGC